VPDPRLPCPTSAPTMETECLLRQELPPNPSQIHVC
jgi:hypothetical protein